MDLGDRVKRYELVFDQKAVINMPLIIRVDGKAFHSLTKKCVKPFDNDFSKAMVKSAVMTAKQLSGFKVGYIQSDEATFCITDYDRVETQGFFDYRVNKIVSIVASYMSVYFNLYSNLENLAVFDCRIFNVPKEDVSNVFLWRARDWNKNSIQMYARSFFSHKELQGKNIIKIHDMLHSIGRNWATDLTEAQKNGTFIINSGIFSVRNDIKPNYNSINSIVEKLIK